MNQRLEKIKGLVDSLNKLRLEDRAYYTFKRTVDDILKELNELQAETGDESAKLRYQSAYSSLAHTNGKEVEYIKYHQDLMHKKGAAKVRATEHRDAVTKAVYQVDMDLMGIFD